MFLLSLYKKLLPLLADYRKIRVSGFPVFIQKISNDGYVIAKFFFMNGQQMGCPEIYFRVNHKTKDIEVISYHHDILHVHERKNGENAKVLRSYLKNLIKEIYSGGGTNLLK